MSLVAAIKFITFLESLVLGGIVLRRAPCDGTSLLFAFYCFCIAASSFVEFQLVSAGDPSQFLFWKQFDTFMYFATIAMFHFALRLAGWKGASDLWFKIVLYGSYVVIAVTEGFILKPVSVARGTWGFTSHYGASALNLHTIFVVVTGALACAIVGILFRCWLRSNRPREKKRLAVLLVTSAILVACGLAAEVTVALFSRTELPLSITATSAYLLLNPLLAFAIVRYDILKLMPGAAAETVLRTMSDGVVLVEPGGTIEFVNTSFSTLTGVPPEHLVGSHFDRIRLRHFLPQESALTFPDICAQKDGFGDRECLLEGVKGNLLPVSLSSAPLRRQGEIIGGFILTFRDVAERKRFEELRLGAERIMRHDLRNALSGILGFSAILGMDESLDSRQRENARLIEQSAMLMTDQIDAYLYLQAIERGAFHPELVPVDIIPLAFHAIDMLQSLGRERHVRCQLLWNGRLAGTDAHSMVLGIRSLFSGMMVNLIKNALEAAPFGSMVTVRIDQADGVAFSVHNFGTVPPEVRSRFFTQYVSFGKKKGTGLGTYSARLVAEALGGRIAFSTGEEQGTTVRVEFPVSAAAARASIQP